MRPSDSQITNLSPADHLHSLERRRPAKAGLHATGQYWIRDGEALSHAIFLARLSRKEAAARIGMDPSQLTKECEGAERPQIERFLADDVLRGPMVVALASQDPSKFDVATTITVRCGSR